MQLNIKYILNRYKLKQLPNNENRWKYMCCSIYYPFFSIYRKEGRRLVLKGENPAIIYIFKPTPCKAHSLPLKTTNKNYTAKANSSELHF